jgi:hypothetical protein
MADRGGAEAGIDADKQHPHAGSDAVGQASHQI